MRNRLGEAVGVVIAFAGVVLLALLSLPNAGKGSVFSSYDTGRNGYRALYALLHRERVAVSRMEYPLGLLTPGVRTLVISQSRSGIDRNEVLALRQWVRGGGRMIALDTSFNAADKKYFGIPQQRRAVPRERIASPPAPRADLPGVRRIAGDFAAVFARGRHPHGEPLLVTRSGTVALAIALGKGEVVAILDPSVFSNVRLRDAGNARFAYDLLAGGPVAFDERIHGYARERGFWQALPPPVRAAVFIVAAVIVLGLVGENVRFAPALTPPAEDDRDSSAYIDSMARLFERGRAVKYAIAACADAATRSARVRYGGTGERIDDPVLRDGMTELLRLRGLERPAPADLLRAGVLAARLRKERG